MTVILPPISKFWFFIENNLFSEKIVSCSQMIPGFFKTFFVVYYEGRKSIRLIHSMDTHILFLRFA